MAKTKDIGLEHLQKQKIKSARDYNKLVSEIWRKHK